MNETDYLSILDERVPRCKWSFHQEALAAAVFLFCILPLLLAALFTLLMVIANGLSLPVMS